jgi:hypothetical protein
VSIAAAAAATGTSTEPGARVSITTTAASATGTTPAPEALGGRMPGLHSVSTVPGATVTFTGGAGDTVDITATPVGAGSLTITDGLWPISSVIPRSRIIIDNRFGALQAEMDRGVRRSLGQAAYATIAVARAVPTDYDIADIKNRIAVGTPRRTRRGWELDIVWTDPRVWLFERGTYRKRGALKSRRRDTGEGNRGVKRVGFIRQGLKVGRVALIDAVQRNLR